ncbi:uncharacterized protein BDCG_06898 [Blastomyces dermatitidis ER-3]|uniref:NmrA-like domain-containing protein n=1 Tax=Ajellomyces dermatitidis (strain ER-3 / ATCC MYA-2586) TaxID=559297 RepID=A0ABP2F490_AJEDR|nr:uncharacterized protein BDCG_06898 [Blastomyces dermatitidis ER-3]EEQ91778.2 hypothetical protein BDCG_06898 [Blastomyces dermatitidis ER-3]
MYFQTRSFHTQFDHDEGSNRWDQWARPIHCPLHLDANVPPIYFLSRYSNPGLAAKGWQVLEVDYSNSSSLRYALTGIDTVISTISGEAEIALIDAAAHVHVRRFVPSEFEGPPSMRPAGNVLDRGNENSLALLQYYEQYGMQYAVFACGIFYERFAPGGMAAFQLGKGTYIDGEGEYLMNIRMMKAEIPYFNVLGAPVVVCMTSAQDLARYIVAALDLPQWTTEFRVCGRRMTLGDIVKEAEIIRVNVSPQKFRHWLHAAWTPALQ